VGAGGKGVKQSCDAFRGAGMKDVSLKLYEGDRHEVLNEKDKAQVWADVLAWLEEKRSSI
jgi:alpha-beta hydrolase superfamily lysophospholipase